MKPLNVQYLRNQENFYKTFHERQISIVQFSRRFRDADITTVTTRFISVFMYFAQFAYYIFPAEQLAFEVSTLIYITKKNFFTAFAALRSIARNLHNQMVQ